MREGQFQSAGKTVNFTDGETLATALDLYQLLEDQFHGSKSIETARMEEIIKHIVAGLPLTAEEWNIFREIKTRHADELATFQATKAKDGQDPAVPEGSGRIEEAFALLPVGTQRRIREEYKTESATPKDRHTTAPHLLDSALHDLAHASQHADRLNAKDVRSSEQSLDFNVEHLVRHVDSARDHISRLGQHLESHPSSPQVFQTERKVLAKLKEALVRKPTVCVDFDGTIHEGPHGLPGKVEGHPLPGSQDALRKLAEKYHVVILTARATPGPIWSWLRENGMAQYVKDVTNVKPPALAYIDDRGVHFDGDWLNALKQVAVVKESLFFPPYGLDIAASPEHSCSTCKMFVDGHCTGYGNWPVESYWVCKSWDQTPDLSGLEPEQVDYINTVRGR